MWHHLNAPVWSSATNRRSVCLSGCADAVIRFDLSLLVDLSRASCITAAGSQSGHYRPFRIVASGKLLPRPTLMVLVGGNNKIKKNNNNLLPRKLFKKSPPWKFVEAFVEATSTQVYFLLPRQVDMDVKCKPLSWMCYFFKRC